MNAMTQRRRHVIRVRGTVQGVGFPPAVCRIARAAGLTGLVRDEAEGVWIEIEGNAPALQRFAEDLLRKAPPLASITSVEVTEVAQRNDHDFRMEPAEARGGIGALLVDRATCPTCLRELFDLRDRRYRYPFVACANCGPRYTILQGLPYGRARTTMSAFAMCARCLAEYRDPSSRRFHAEANACPQCGPRVAIVERGEVRAVGDAALWRAAELLDAGAIVALKGLGGYQLAVDATSDAAVTRLRLRKRRPQKPFAVMAPDIAWAERVAHIDPSARDALASPARPVVLCPLTGHATRVAASVAPRLSEIALALPTTPLHHLLLADGPPLLVMTSGNITDEPIARADDEAIRRLASVADAVLTHDRVIQARVEDSVVRPMAGAVRPLRRACGMAPAPIALGFDAPPILAVGAQQDGTVCVTRGGDAYLSQHIGDLDDPDVRSVFEEVTRDLTALLGVTPAAIAHDLHPDCASTRWALRHGRGARAQGPGPACVGVQHHHAHIAACLVEHGHLTRAIGVALDDTGCGPAGEPWGGEVLLADLADFTRVGHLRFLALAGGEAAVRAPWRLALAALVDAGEPLDLLDGVPEADRTEREAVLALLARSVASPRTSSAARWFDAVGALAAARGEITYAAQASMELEALAAVFGGSARPYPFAIIDAPDSASFEIDMRPVVRALARDLRGDGPRAEIAARFHVTMAEIVADAARRAATRARRGLRGADAHETESEARTVALSGACFQNRLLTELTVARLTEAGFDVLLHRRAPPNDGGLALGQAAVAAYRLRGQAPPCA